jgi:hypothetical protein
MYTLTSPVHWACAERQKILQNMISDEISEQVRSIVESLHCMLQRLSTLEAEVRRISLVRSPGAETSENASEEEAK